MKLGFIGTGLMGAPMVSNLDEAGYKVKIYNRTREKAEKLVSKNVRIANRVDEVIEDSDIVFIMLTDNNSIKELLLNNNFDFKNKTIIQMSTIKPSENIELKNYFENLDCSFIEAPVLGSIPQIKEKTLITIFGGSEKEYEKWKFIFEPFGNKIIYAGECGKASTLKLALNHLIATLTASFSMSLGYVRENGLDVETFMGILRDSALYAPTFDKKMKNYLNNDFSNPNFPLKHMLKDVNLIAESFSEQNIEIGMLEELAKVLEKGISDGDGEKDYSAMYRSIVKK